jgi:hypothetical protein
MSIIQQAIAHFSNKAVHKVEVPEWGTTLYVKNLNLDDRSKISSRADGNTTDYMVYAVIFGAMDEKGEPVFTIEDKPMLRTRCDPAVVTRIANAVLDVKSKSEEEREKNS